MNWAPPQARVGLCAPCAQGKACSCSTPCNCKGKPVTVAGITVGGWAPRAMVGLIGGERAIPWPQIEEFDAMTRQLDTDIGKWTAADTSGGPNAVPASLPFKLKWDGWYIGWRAWFATQAEVKWTDFSIIGIKIVTGPRLLEYDVKRLEYDELLREAKEKGVSTAAVDAPKSSPLEDIVKKGGEGALDLAGSAAKWGGLVLLAVGVGYAGLLLLPTFSAAIARRVG